MLLVLAKPIMKELALAIMNKKGVFEMWDAQELLDSLNRECAVGDIVELYTALLFYELGFTEVDRELSKEVMRWYYDNDDLTSFLNSEVVDYAKELLEKE